MITFLTKILTIITLLFPATPIHHNFKIIDGDTIKVNGTSVRLLGINTPERGERCYFESKFLLTQLINDSTQLKRDIENKDKYNRELRHAFYENTYLQEIMVHTGNSKTLCIWPNIKYCETLLKSEQDAINNGRGCLFTKSNNTCITISDLECKGSWIEIQNNCDYAVNLSKLWIENRGRDRLHFERMLDGSETKKYFFKLYDNDAIYLFDNSGLIDFETC